MFFLLNFVFAILATTLDNLFGITIDGIPYGPIYIIYALALLIPGIALAVRRLHDVGKSGWMYFIIFIPFVGAIWLLILFVTQGDPEANEYGEVPTDE